MTGWDWYATFAGLAGVDPTDHEAAAVGLPPIDSIDVWPYLAGQTGTSPRQEIPLGSSAGVGNTWCVVTIICETAITMTTVCIIKGVHPSTHTGAYCTTRSSSMASSRTMAKGISGRWECQWKIIFVLTHGRDDACSRASLTRLCQLLVGNITMDGWQGPSFPNITFSNFGLAYADCSRGCLFDLVADPAEHRDVAAENPDLMAQVRRVSQKPDIPGHASHAHVLSRFSSAFDFSITSKLLARLKQHNATTFSPDRGEPEPAACQHSIDYYDGYYGPWLQLGEGLP